ncbi:sensor histidine kinase [Streptomyces sp. NPDC004609]|uniref:sensor histidine kinase n=1 Tax=Streptomyces sp. NPDC004609 TaxID=3364704 RepID=UPI003675640F
MPISRWAEWPARESLSRIGVPRSRIAVDVLLLSGLATWAVSSAYTSDVFRGWRAVLPVLGLMICVVAVLGFHRTTTDNRLSVSLALLTVLAALGWAGYWAGASITAAVLWITVSALAVERLPIVFGLVTGLLMAGSFSMLLGDVLGTVITAAGMLLGGCTLRQDAEARGAGFRLLAQERAARRAEAVSAALAERARIAREIHDVLAHSLSAQLVHLEAARIQIERGPEGPFRDQILERVVAARGMAREGLAETRQALSALRGEMVPVEDYLREIAAEDGAETVVAGERRPLPAEASQAVRRVAQEALTNARKHAPGARVRMTFAYEEGGVTLEVRNWGTTASGGELGASGSGYGLLGMRERAELLGGALEAGPEGEGFMVRLRVQA